MTHKMLSGFGFNGHLWTWPMEPLCTPRTPLEGRAALRPRASAFAPLPRPQRCPAIAVHRPPQALKDHLDQHPLNPHSAQWLLRDVTFLAHRLLHPLTPHRLDPCLGVAALLLNATAPYLDAPKLVDLLLRALDAACYSAAPPLSPTDDAAMHAVLCSLADAIRPSMASQCPPHKIDLRDGALALSITTYPLSGLPQDISAGLGRFHLPQSLPASVKAQNPGFHSGRVQVVTNGRQAASGLLAPPVSMELWDVARGVPLHVQGLPDPVAVSWSVNGTGLRRPVEDWYRCVYATADGWSADGTWLSPAALGTAVPTVLTCHTSHLSTFSIQTLPRVERVSGCGDPTGPTALHCRPAPPALTITGAHFGPSGAAVTLRARDGALEWQCPAVRHVPGHEDTRLTCDAANASALPPDFAGQWASVEVATAHGTAHTLRHAVLFAAPPVLSAVAPLPGGGCVRAARGALVDCRVAGAAFALSGEFCDRFTTVAFGPFKCPDVVLRNRTYLECHGATGTGGPHVIRIEVGLGADLLSSAPAVPLTIAFEAPCASKPGHWTGRDCGMCQPAYYGPGCQYPCPGAPSVCGGHGTCDSGVGGTGACTCDAGPGPGYWAGSACERCAAGYVGASCSAACPMADPQGAAPRVPCGGRGVCRAMTQGGGAECVCEHPFAGAACERRCPADGALRPCAGHGTCVGGQTSVQGRCECAGHWSGDACLDCAAGWVGPNCSGACPAAPQGLCSGHGRCVWTGATAACVCGTGYVGAVCAQRCPADAAEQVCGGHGACTSTARGAAACVCAADASAGHWGGALCDACAPGYAGIACTGPCPTDPQGRVCSGAGYCTPAGACKCANGTCGGACERAAADCTATSCAPGLYGPRCEGVCACGTHGACLDGPYGTGACHCDAGWVGAACSVHCEGSADGVPCYGHGQCSLSNGTCACLPHWRTPPGADACSVPCPGPAALPCSAHGVCDAAARCVCDPGYGGADCALPCPTDAAAMPCGGHGTCGEGGRCVCAAGPAMGYWGGPVCTACVPGRFGPGCRDVCVSGVTVGLRCLCTFGWAGADCGIECPGGADRPCSSHGACNATSGSCTCTAGFAGPACARRCPAGAGTGTACSGHGACDPHEGVCVCQDSAAGHWAGAACDACRAPYFGPACTFVCPRDNATGLVCGGHGACSPTGGCLCHATAVEGHWAGPLCLGCAPQHYGPNCRAVCPGGACSPCGGHGVCSEGLHGNGTCTCESGPALGHWAPASGCTDCQSGYYSSGCLQECPGGATLPCGGHGTCSDGLHGSGACTCVAAEGRGFWAGPACGACARGYHGAACAAECPGGGQSPCGGHGECDGGRNGTGRCACDAGYAGAACGAACPQAGGRVCGGHGACRSTPDGAGAVCHCWGSVTQGYWYGEACVACQPGYDGPACDRECPGGADSPCAGHGTCHATDAVPVCACDVGYAGADCSTACPGLSEGRVCSGHGACDVATGACVCVFGATTGYWAGAACNACAEGWSGTACATACPMSAGLVCSAGRCSCDAATCGVACEATGAVCVACAPGTWGLACNNTCPGTAGQPCGGHGRCLDGSLGSGACVCDPGYAGHDCGQACPGSPPCSGHGACDLDRVRCVCTPGYAGPACHVACPKAAGSLTVCGGPARGLCFDGAAGNGTCGCAAGHAGPACELRCKGLGPAGPCMGHGSCRAFDGTCECDGHWGGEACVECVSGWYGDDCAAQCVGGGTVGTACICAPGWAGPGCRIECAGGSTSPCSGHGRCNDTAVGDGMCACDLGWHGGACDVPCAGVLAGLPPCSGHGTCLTTGACECYAAPGRWAGAECDRCTYGYVGPLCDRPCPLPKGVVCAGHGTCRADTGSCDCFESPKDGYWDTTANCTECLSGYWGPQCAALCPGGACLECSGHGVCDAGVNGTGACRCAAQWMGVACDECVSAFYGPTCTSPCPTHIPVAHSPGAVPLVCSGYGRCHEGRFGSGECACDQSPGSGYWAGPNCSACTPGYWGPDCRAVCPGMAEGAACAGHGRCNDGRHGDGRCACHAPWGGAACRQTCPAVGDRVCNSVGACEPDAAICNCSAAPRGRWAGPACGECREGWVGDHCDLPCPSVGPAALVCAGAGLCRAAVGARAAVCACYGGYYGTMCEGECPGGHFFPCSGHGTCDPINGVCACYAGADAGHFAGLACDRCAEGWSGAACRDPCPVGAGGVACSGHRCQDGGCYCGAGACGAACELTGSVCFKMVCPDGHYGSGCRQSCPRGKGGSVCSGHGGCLSMVYGDGACGCDAGYAGGDCGLTCAGGAARPCTGHGACDPVDGACSCIPGYAGPACALVCPVRGGRVCAGHGVCNDTAAGDGACACDVGYALSDCGRVCPGFDPGHSAFGACSGHGACDPATAACVCWQTPEEGFWAGEACQTCIEGWFGDDCLRECVHGHTEGRVCVCREGYAAANCSVACPGPVDNRCNGHGLCRDNNTGDGTCLCDVHWYSPDCSVFCDASLCFREAAGRIPPHAQCNAVTGHCECQRNATGYWDGPQCDVCLLGYWGLDCAEPCDCNYRGACGWLDGVCDCFKDEVRPAHLHALCPGTV